eukprot:gnl/TRDRNA2_/TRDRNA2_44467_c0_seq1.p1 gnl/TRDRNA2_/TRDRNA2_44467_c0~~gnl/TRDRNA2_/TRDRNA2_44467_c0_seq1.p1  ORF type:complete len:604 (-),score=77.96 gnl/TRDRNA2_/TRDRNA2_44467_c0_seq1:108-1880(-)
MAASSLSRPCRWASPGLTSADAVLRGSSPAPLSSPVIGYRCKSPAGRALCRSGSLMQIGTCRGRFAWNNTSAIDSAEYVKRRLRAHGSDTSTAAGSSDEETDSDLVHPSNSATPRAFLQDEPDDEADGPQPHILWTPPPATLSSAHAAVDPRAAEAAAALRQALCEAIEGCADEADIEAWCNIERLRESRSVLAEAISSTRLQLPCAKGEQQTLLVEALCRAEDRRRRIQHRIEDLRGQVRVLCRVRPLIEQELAHGERAVVRALDGVTLEAGQSDNVFSFDGVFCPGDPEQIFEDCRDLVQSATDGHNVTIFAYGQTGTGKTHTMYGTPDEKGITQHMGSELFRIVETMRTHSTVYVTASMVELYNNEISDLLRPTDSFGKSAAKSSKLFVRQRNAAPSHGTARDVIVENLEEVDVENEDKLLELLSQGLAQRSVAAHAMNTDSSRSHLITTIKIESVHHQSAAVVRSKILFVDLAGSERLKKTAAHGQRQKEAIEINRSLTALGDVIAAISQGQRQVPYRNHKLTQLMQDSLGGTAKTLMLVHCTPASSSLSETNMSLKYAARAKHISNKPVKSAASGANTPSSQVLR